MKYYKLKIMFRYFQSEKKKEYDEITQRQIDLISEIDKGTKGFFYGDLEDDKEYIKMQKENGTNNVGNKSNSFEFINHSDIKVDFEQVKFLPKDMISRGAYGRVYKFTDGTNYDERYVVKKMPKFFSSDVFLTHLPKMFHKEVVAFRFLSNYGVVPRIIFADYEKRFYVMERLDKTLNDLIEDCEFEPKHVQPFIDLMCKITLTPYRHNDFHSNNIMWSEKHSKFFFIDWGLFSLLGNSKPLENYPYLRKRMPNIDKKKKVYHKKGEPHNLHLKGYANHIMYYALLLFREKEPLKWGNVFLEYDEYYGLITHADDFIEKDYEDYIRKKFAYLEKNCDKKKKSNGGSRINRRSKKKLSNKKNSKKFSNEMNY